MKDNAKRNEWMEFRAKHPREADWKVFYDWAKDPKSSFHEDLEWSVKRAAEKYYHKKCFELILKYDRIYCNVTTSYQRLHATYDAVMAEKKISRRVAKTAAEIAKNDEELAYVRAAIWSRLRRVTSDMNEFNEYLPEFKEIYNLLLPFVQSELVSINKGAAAQ